MWGKHAVEFLWNPPEAVLEFRPGFSCPVVTGGKQFSAISVMYTLGLRQLKQNGKSNCEENQNLHMYLSFSNWKLCYWKPSKRELLNKKYSRQGAMGEPFVKNCSFWLKN